MADFSVRAEHVFCRTLSHQWQPNGSLERGAMGGPGGVVTLKLTLHCANSCGVRREDFILPSTGEVVLRRYFHPDGYLMTGVEERPTRSDFRRRFIQKRKVVNVGIQDYRPRAQNALWQDHKEEE